MRVAVTRAQIGVEVSVFDTLVASVSTSTDSAESWAGFAGLTIDELEIAAPLVLREALGGA